MAPSTSRGGYLPLSTDSRFQRSRWTVTRLIRNGPPAAALIALALVTGLFGGLALSAYGHRPESLTCLLPTGGSDTPSQYSTAPPTASIPTPSFHEEDLDLETLRDVVSRTKGYYARDYSMALGWNNMRYIIETALFHGVLLNRTVVLPSFVYARSCEFDITVCASYAPMVNRGDAVHSDEWRKLPEAEQMGWRIPLSVMVNMTHLRQTQPVILVSEYLRLHNLSLDHEASNGQWETEKYHQHASIFETDPTKKPSLHIIENHWYDPKGINRIDYIPDDMRSRGNWNPEGGAKGKGEVGSWGTQDKSRIYTFLAGALSGRQHVLEWDKARSILQGLGVGDVSTDEALEKTLRDNGWEVLYTYDGALGMEYIKNVVFPIRQVAPRDSLRGLKEDYGDVSADVLLVKGEIHYERKPAGLRFTTIDSRDKFSRLVLYNMRPTDSVIELAALLDSRMKEKTGGRMWMGAHMRRGDFVRTNWAMEKEFGDHLKRIKKHLSDGRSLLWSLRESDLTTYGVPDVSVDRSILKLSPPHENDKFYIATDERDPGNLAYLRDHGGVLASDLLTIEDRRKFGWPLMVTDVLGLVEQATLARGAYFYAHALSSVAGGALNIRAARGADPRTAVID
ncbi:hypothetical protein BV22DRAFT_1030029 [Leucogyrophana mollusca]|uniref:Uncharacterized protein n=1 Tax=Leucogyrophana mollusca TaxID=85980 RepID=A0ACB8BUN0_9AGAM|nr:hypothetical protein BV22DRAFT_1030029 [Leucogyrophana mollusca]